MNLVDTRDINLLGEYRINPVPNLVSKNTVCAKLCAKLVIVNLVKTRKSD